MNEPAKEDKNLEEVEDVDPEFEEFLNTVYSDGYDDGYKQAKEDALETIQECLVTVAESEEGEEEEE